MSRATTIAPPPSLPSPPMTREELAKAMVGRLATFYASPNSVVGCLVIPSAKLYVGQVIASEPTSPTPQGAIPDYLVTIRGRTGKTATVSATSHYVQLFDSWKEAITHSETT